MDENGFDLIDWDEVEGVDSFAEEPELPGYEQENVASISKIGTLASDMSDEIMNYMSRQNLDCVSIWDTIKILGYIERILANIIKELSASYVPMPKKSVKPTRKSGKTDDLSGLIDAYQSDSFIIVKTPLLNINPSTNARKAQCYEPLLDKKLASIHPFPPDITGVIMYVLAAYPSNTPVYRIMDADNMNVKAVGDRITRILRIDDSGLNFHLYLGAKLTDNLTQGAYYVITPKSDRILNPNEVENVILKGIINVQKTMNF
jgi:hypothetical protein